METVFLAELQVSMSNVAKLLSWLLEAKSYDTNIVKHAISISKRTENVTTEERTRMNQAISRYVTATKNTMGDEKA